MTQKQFNEAIAGELKRAARRFRLLTEADAGKVEMQKVTVHRKKMTWTVRAKHRTYTRLIAPTGWKARAA